MAQFYPSGMLGVGLTALMASFMSGMAGNVTAFNTVFTYDIYQSYIRPNATDRHYLTVGRMTTVVGVVLSIATAYLAAQFNNIMDFLQLVFGFVNRAAVRHVSAGHVLEARHRPRRVLRAAVAAPVAAALTHGLTVAEGKGGWIANVHDFPSQMAQNFWIAIFAWTTCFAGDDPGEPDDEAASGERLRGLVYGLTEIPWERRVVVLAVVVALALVVLNLMFR